MKNFQFKNFKAVLDDVVKLSSTNKFFLIIIGLLIIIALLIVRLT